jgi:hypothetical protein
METTKIDTSFLKKMVPTFAKLGEGNGALSDRRESKGQFALV